MAISRCFETTKERLDNIFKTKMIDPDLGGQYFRGLHPFMEMKTARKDVISGCIRFINETVRENTINTYNFHIEINSGDCIISCVTGRYSFPKIFVRNYKSQFIVLEFIFEDNKKFNYEEYQICNYAMLGLAEALGKLYKEYCKGDRDIFV